MSSKEDTLLSIHTPGWLYDIPYLGIDTLLYFIYIEENEVFVIKRYSFLFGYVVWCNVERHNISYYRCTRREKPINGKNVKGPFRTLEEAKEANTSVFLSNHQFNVPPYFIQHVPVKRDALQKPSNVPKVKTNPIGKKKQNTKIHATVLASLYQKEKELRVEYWSSLLSIAKIELALLSK